jgi:hypothetical protein
MKKLTLKLDAIKEMLTKEQMKKISGGSDDPCDSECYFDIECARNSYCECAPVYPPGACDYSVCACYPYPPQ